MTPRAARRRGGIVLAMVLALLLTLTPGQVAHADEAPSVGPTGAVTEQAATVPVRAEPDGTPVTLDTSTFTPGTAGRHPALLLAHGFGGSKADLTTRARDLAALGYVVVTWSARGFGASGGRIHLDDPDFEVADARKLVDGLASRSDVLLDGTGDPRLGVVGGSYGGALALMLGATDKRVDTVVASITWNDLAEAFFPQNASTGAPPASPADVAPTSAPGPFKQLWASTFFGSVNSARGQAASTSGSTGSTASPSATATTAPTGATPQTSPVCGRFDPTVCRLFLATAESGQPSQDLIGLLRSHSPKPLLQNLTQPTYLIQGMADTLFGLDQADATSRALSAQGTPVAVRWMDGGHDGTSSTATADEDSARTWLAHYLSGPRPEVGDAMPVPAFVYAAPIPRRQTVAPLLQSTRYVGSATSTLLPLNAEPARPVLTPPGGEPSSITAVPGAGALAALPAAYQLAALPGQSTAFDSPPLDARTQVVGAPRVRLTVTSTAPSVTLYLSLWQVSGGTATLPRRLVAPLTVATTPGSPTTIDAALPAATWTFESGAVVRLLVTSTDSAYAGPRVARADQITLEGGGLTVPVVAGTTLSAASDLDPESIGVAIAIAVALLGLGALAWSARRRRRASPARPDLADVPLVVTNLVKTYQDGHRAVDDVSWRAERGHVVGLLGPNGAGKTTTLRMVMGLIRPDSGTVHVLGQPIHAGAPVLASVGALIEGPGFLPHLTGMQNLHAYWAATGRPESDAAYEQVLEVAALGGSVERPVRSYSHGMRQRLGIAQAMLGLPDVLVLDEPTNGLDPPQIAAMRPILHRYAETGRTVVVSSHLLAEVEMTCSDVVVMHAGRVVTSGTVAELVDSADTTVIQLGAGGDAEALAQMLCAVTGITSVEVEDDPSEPRVIVTAELPRAELVRLAAETGVDIVGVSSRRHLEDVFLGVIAAAQSSNGSGGSDSDEGSRSLGDRLRQVRAR
ncbi:MAG: CocE/NonD family hydrolase [Actinomycetota bacterium]|nr:CocE/NonD family hydrolase [Actinomycetota bacterium]